MIRARLPGFVPRVGLVLGSGLGAIAEAIEDAVAIDYAGLPGFPRPSIEGHAGRLVLGRLAGVPVACLQGRVHLYEGVPAGAVNVLPRTLKALGCEILILTNAAGSLRPEIEPGAIALIEDHINLLGQNPLAGPNDAAIGPRFPDMTEVYDRDLRARARAVAARLEIPLCAGVYLATLGTQLRDAGGDPGVSRARARNSWACPPFRKRSAPAIAGSRCSASRSSPISPPGSPRGRSATRKPLLGRQRLPSVYAACSRGC